MCYKIPFEVTEVKLIYQNKVKAEDCPQIKGSLEAYQILLANWSEQINFNEEFYILLLNRANRVIGHYLVSQGSLVGTIVDAKAIFAAALKCRAASIILAHNHPSCNLRPSQSDIELTKKLKQGGELLDIAVLDHLILSPDGGYYSFADEGLL